MHGFEAPGLHFLKACDRSVWAVPFLAMVSIRSLGQWKRINEVKGGFCDTDTVENAEYVLDYRILIHLKYPAISPRKIHIERFFCTFQKDPKSSKNGKGARSYQQFPADPTGIHGKNLLRIENLPLPPTRLIRICDLSRRFPPLNPPLFFCSTTDHINISSQQIKHQMHCQGANLSLHNSML